MTQISIVIPVYQEEKLLEACVQQFAGQNDLEIIMVDGGSTDRTLKIAESFNNVKIIRTAHPGRGHQMNAGAVMATGEWILFVHADCLLPANWRHEIYRATSRGFTAGCFRIRYVFPKKRPLLPLIPNWHSLVSRFPYGDQAIFIKRNIFQKMGGYQELPIMEDYEFSLRYVHKIGSFYRSHEYVAVSFRRFTRHPLRLSVMMLIYPPLFRCGVSPKWLARFYEVIR